MPQSLASNPMGSHSRISRFGRRTPESWAWPPRHSSQTFTDGVWNNKKPLCILQDIVGEMNGWMRESGVPLVPSLSLTLSVLVCLTVSGIVSVSNSLSFSLSLFFSRVHATL